MEAKKLTQDKGTIIKEAYWYLYPLVLMELTRKQMTNVQIGDYSNRAPMNHFAHVRRFPLAGDREVVRPSFDTLYSLAWIDVKEEPQILSVPTVEDRQIMLPILDMWSDVIAIPGTRTLNCQSGKFALATPDWDGELPEDVERINVTTPYVWMIGRTQTNGVEDYDYIHSIQDQYTITKLSEYGNEQVSQSVADIDPDVDMTTPPLHQLLNMNAKQFFEFASKLTQIHPQHATDFNIKARMRQIGFEYGQEFSFDALDDELRALFDEVLPEAQSQIGQQIKMAGVNRNNWTIMINSIGVYGNDYLKRAFIAQIGLGANPPEEAIYPICIADDNNEPLDGSRKYVWHFDADKLPPVDGFWSLTMYDAEGFQVANDLNRFAIGDRDNLTYNEDGSLDIYIQHESPGEDKESNWLPSPESGELGVTLRLYLPRTEILTLEWEFPPIRRAE